jgi:cell division protein ZipA
MRLEKAPAVSHSGEEGRKVRATLDPDPTDLGDWSHAGGEQGPQFAMDLNFDAHGDSDYLNTDPALHGEVERKIVVMNLVRRDGGLSGTAIEKACAAMGLKPGDMAIYHRHEKSGDRVVFSMASMVEPGSFPIGDMGSFSTPGLTLFTQLPGVRDGVEIYDEMLRAAQQLAKLLNAELQDDGHNKLTRQMQEHTRESIIEHRRKIRLARSRH